MRATIVSLAVAILVLGIVAHSSAVPLFTDWTAFTASSGGSGSAAGDGTATGTLTAGGNTTVVTYAGDVRVGSGVTTDIGGTSTFFSNVISPGIFTPPLAMSDLIANDGGVDNTHTISFAQAVINPVLHILSLGDDTAMPPITVDWTFTNPFTILSSNAALSNPSGNLLIRGTEGSGTLRFTGTFSQLSWVSNGVERTTGFQVGAEIVTPEPGTWILMGTGLAGLAFYGWRNRKQEGAATTTT